MVMGGVRLLWVMTGVQVQRVLGGGSAMAVLHLLLLHRLLALVPLATAPFYFLCGRGHGHRGGKLRAGTML